MYNIGTYKCVERYIDCRQKNILILRVLPLETAPLFKGNISDHNISSSTG